MANNYIKSEKKEKILILTIDRPENTNKLNIPCMKEIISALKDTEKSGECGAVILTGTGEYFCNGGELGDYRRQSSMDIREFGKYFIDLHLTITGLRLPVIAAVQGDALGGGFSLVEACDLAVASDRADFGVPEINFGLAPMMALTGLSKILTRKGVMELSLLGKILSAQEACEIGLVNWVCGEEELMEKAIRIAGELSEKSPTAIALCKKLYQETEQLLYKRDLEAGLNMLVSLLKSDDAHEALTAREAKRHPQWKVR